MINTFETQTEALSQQEKKIILPRIKQGLLRRKGKENIISNPQICDKLLGEGIKIKPERVRKIISILVLTGEVKNLVASSKGYWISNDRKEMTEYAQSLKDRIKANELRHDAIIRDIKTMFGE